MSGWRGIGVVGLCALAIAACSSGSDAKANDEPVGKVVALSGQVTAQRPAAEARPLTMNAPVFRDDTVVTTAGASVTLALDHNNARWDIAENQTHRVDQSLAWKAPKGSSGTSLDEVPNDHTAAAGRHSENEAAQTAGTALGDEGAPAPPPPAAKAEPLKVKKAERRKAKAKRPRAQPREKDTADRAAAVAAPPPPPPEPKPSPRPAADAPDLERAKKPGGQTKGSIGNIGSIGRGSKGSSGGKNKGAGITRGSSVSAASLIRKKLKTCYVLDGDEKTGRVKVTVTIDKRGAITKVSVSAGSGLAAVGACVKRKLKGAVVAPSKSGKASASMTFR